MSSYNFRGIAYLLDCCEYDFEKGLFKSTALYAPAPRPMDSTTVLHSLVFVARVFTIGAFVTIFFVLGSLLEGELARAWVDGVRRAAKRHQA